MLIAIGLSLLLNRPKYDIALITHHKKMQVVATAYCPKEGHIGGGNRTKTGDYVRKGVIAVDSKVIPLYSRVRIPGYGEALALDTGGAINRSHIDLAFDSVSEMRKWGKRYIRIDVIEEPASRHLTREQMIKLRHYYGLDNRRFRKKH